MVNRLWIYALVVGVFLQFFAIFGNRGPFPLVTMALSPDYLAAHEGYRTLFATGSLKEGDKGFSEIRRVFLSLSLMSQQLPFDIDEIDGVTITEFHGGMPEDPDAPREEGLVAVTYSNGESDVLDFTLLHLFVAPMRSKNIPLVNAVILLLGCGLAFYGLRERLTGPGTGERAPGEAG